MAKFTFTNPYGTDEVRPGSIRIAERIVPGDDVEVVILDEYAQDWVATSLATDGWPAINQTEGLKEGETRTPGVDKLDFDFNSLSQQLVDSNTVILKFKMPRRPTTIQMQLNYSQALYSGSAGGSGGVRPVYKSRPLSVTVFPER